MADRPVIVWFRKDLRLTDNPALQRALELGQPVLPVFILDRTSSARPLGAASHWWLNRSLRALGDALEGAGSRLILRSGPSEGVLFDLIRETGAQKVLLNRRFDPEGWQQDTDIAHALASEGIDCKGFNGNYLATPGSIRSPAGTPYKVFTPFKKALLGQVPPPKLTVAPQTLPPCPDAASEALESWGLHPRNPDWSTGFDWTPGEAGAVAALEAFIGGGLATYGEGRDLPGTTGSSRLSPHLHWGEVHPWRVIEAVRAANRSGPDTETYVSEIVWREFSAHLLHHFPQMVQKAFRPEFDAMPWRDDAIALRAWQKGLTGYPLVDAGMRQLWQTGWMHNRVRMVVASFLTKHLLMDWRMGEAWFWDTLVDADLASNVQNWQWVAGSGADAAPYFRIFNPTLQSQKFDPDGTYIRQWVPELARLPARYIHQPETTPADMLARAGVRLGQTYPRPIVIHEFGRKRALDALEIVKQGGLGEM